MSRVQVVYLDQSHLSRMAKARLGVARAPDPGELALLGALEAYCATGAVICPFSCWHLFETVVHDNDLVRDEVCRIVGRLSQGRCFVWPLDLVLDEMAAASAPLSDGQIATAAPIGRGVDCFPRDVIAPETHGFVATLAPERQFAESVEVGRSTPDIRRSAQGFIASQHAVDVAMAASRQSNQLDLDRARPLVVESIAEHVDFKRWVARIARATGRTRREIAARSTRDHFASVPTLRVLAEVRARRDVVHGRRPLPSDPFDAGHLLALPYSDWFLTERFATELTRHVGRATNTTVLASPQELSDALAAAIGPP